MTFALFRRRRPAPAPPPTPGLLAPPVAPRCAVPAVPREREPLPGVLGCVVVVHGRGRPYLTHASLMTSGEAAREAYECQRHALRTGSGLTYEVWPVGAAVPP